MIEDFDLTHRTFFEEEDHETRWTRLVEMFVRDPGSARVLFMTEVAALIDHWREPTKEELTRLLELKIEGGRIAFPMERVHSLLLPVWALELAKYDVHVLQSFDDGGLFSKYFLTGVRLSSTALVNVWWAFETMMNDLAGIMVTQRKETLSDTDRALIEEKSITLNAKGRPERRPYFQPIDVRVQYIYALLTGEEIDRSTTTWMDLRRLKNARDSHVHRLGKDDNRKEGGLYEVSLVVKGLKAVQALVADVFAKTPELTGKFAYRFLAFWSCRTETPFIWDGREGDGLFLGLGAVDVNHVLQVSAPMPGSFSSDGPLAGGAPAQDSPQGP